MSAPQRILIVRLGAMGDIIHAMPTVAALRKAFPATLFGWVVEERWATLLTLRHDHCPASPVQPLADYVHPMDTRRWRKSLFDKSTRREVRSAVGQIRRSRYELAIDFQGSIKSAIIAQLSSVQERYGFANPWEWPSAIFYNKKSQSLSAHVVDQNFDLAGDLARSEANLELDRNLSAEFPSDPFIETKSEKMLQDFGLKDGFAILNPGAGWRAKQWPADRYAEVARALGKGGVRSLVNFGPGEESLAKIVEEKADGYAIAAQFTISELIAVTRRASLFIGGDTGPLHLAAALKVPVVALFGPTDPARTGPYGTSSIVLRDPSSITSHKRNRDTEAGLMNITSEQVIAAARQLLSGAAK